MRVVLIGAVESTAVALKSLCTAGCSPVGVITLPQQRAGRHADFVDLRPLAMHYHIPVIETQNVNDAETLRQLSGFSPDFTFVIGWSQLLSNALISAAREGCIGYHPSLLPDGRGRGVIPWTIIRGLQETGSTFFWIDEGMDSGDILNQERFAVDLHETSRSLYNKHLGSIQRQLSSLIPRMMNGERPKVPQDHTKATYCSRRQPEDGYIDWNKDAAFVWALIRAAGAPYSGAFTYTQENMLYIVEAELIGPAPYYGFPGQIQRLDATGALVQCGDGNHVLIKIVQRPSEEATSAASVFRIHERLGMNCVSVYNSLIGGIKNS